MAIVVPDLDFDPSEVAVSWQVLTRAGHRVVFASESGRPAAGDDLMLTGQGLDLWSFLPGLRRIVGVGALLRANADARQAYREMAASAEFRAPRRWLDLDVTKFDALLLPGGHRARGMRSFLESATLQELVADAFEAGMPVAAICHGVLLAARSINPKTGRSVLYGRRTTALTWALEKKAWQVARITRFWDPGYYRTYPDGTGHEAGYMSVQAEVTRALREPGHFQDVPNDAPDYRLKTSGTNRDSSTDARPAYLVEDGNYLSARWPGDVHTFAQRFAAKVTDLADRPRQDRSA